MSESLILGLVSAVASIIKAFIEARKQKREMTDAQEAEFLAKCEDAWARPSHTIMPDPPLPNSVISDEGSV